jgi:membrane protein DedA with SNARE-associated domain
MEVLAASRWEHLILWLPAAILGAGLLAGIFILLGRAFVETVRESGHPRWILGGLVALVGVVVLLTYLGVELPRE